MNEELKIIIRAVTQEAEKNLGAVRKELDKINETAKDTKLVDQAMKTVGKGALAAVGGVMALTTAMVALGKSSMEFQKAQAQLNASFASVGLSAEQASQTYKELYGYLGDIGRSTETANLLAQLTQEEESLTEWTNILMGVYAKFPDSLPVESLAEAVNHTAHLGEVQGTLADALEWVGVNVDSFNAALANTNSVAEREALIRQTLNGLYMGSANAYNQANQSLIAYNQSQVAVDQALAEAMKYVVPLMTALNNLTAILLEALKPAFETIASVIIVFVQWIIAAIKAVGSFFGIFNKSATKVNDSIDAVKDKTNNVSGGINKVGDAFKDAAKQAEKLRKQTMGFDELNIMSSQSSAASSGGGAPGSGVAIPEIQIPDVSDIKLPGLDEFEEKVSKVREVIESIIPLVLAVVGGLILWKIADFLTELSAARKLLSAVDGGTFFHQLAKSQAQEYIDGVKTKLMNLAGAMLIAAGAVALIQGFSDAWINGLDWGNFALILGGIAAIVGGMALAFGPLAAAISLVVGGIVALIIGIKDLITNGYSMEGVLMVAAGAIAVVVGAVWAFNAALLANPITWIVVAIMALVAAFVILWNECEGFRNFWIMIWDAIVYAFNATVAWFKQAGEDIAQFFSDAWKAIQKAWNAAGQWFKNIGAAIKNAFTGIGKWFSDIFTGAWNGIKKAFSAVGSFFSGVFNSIKDIFSKVGTAIGSAVSNTVKSAINGILSRAIGIINGFISAINLAIEIINAIPGVNIKLLKKLDVPKLATGGITTGATMAMIGERGKEAVLPLENNTGWMDILADRIASRNNTPSKIVLMVGEKEFGWAAINSINDITKQTGGLQLHIV